jgi:hypothetical protein
MNTLVMQLVDESGRSFMVALGRAILLQFLFRVGRGV